MHGLRSERGWSLEHALVELLESPCQNAKIESLQHDLLAGLAEATAASTGTIGATTMR